MYGIKVNEWYDYVKDKDSNVEMFLELVENKLENCYVIVMVDMFLLLERENKFY